MKADPVGDNLQVASPEGFARFYRAHLPTVYGYLVRLAGGDRALAEDLCQDTWFALTRELERGRTDRADVRWLLTVARSRYLDHARRTALGRRRLRLAGAADSRAAPEESDVPDGLLSLVEQLDPAHRVVLLLRYVEDLPVPAVAEVIGRSLPATHSLLARARDELRVRSGGGPDA